jgi:hypothetical protein
MTEQVQAGRHAATIETWGLSETKNGSVKAYITFKLVDSGVTVYFNNVPASHETAKKILTETLVLLGFNGNDIADLANADAFVKGTEHEIAISYKMNAQGEPNMNIYVVDPSFQGGMNATDAATKLKGLSIKGDLMALKQKRNDNSKTNNVGF